MLSARKFSFAVVKAGRNSFMSKYGMVDAYKCILAPIGDLHLQCFQRLSRYFVELRQMFASKTAMSNFDILGNMILSLTKENAKYLRNFFIEC